MSSEPNRLLRASRLLWGRLGSARIFVAGTVGIILVLAALGIWHLVSLRRQAEVPAADEPRTSLTNSVARVSPGIQSTLLTAPPPPSPGPASSEAEREIAITDVTDTMKQGKQGETLVVATIAMASRTPVEKNNIEIRVFFYDLDRKNQMRPTDAQVTYEWLTPVRDWTDTAPKYLAATYLQPRPFRRSADQLHYGGFVVRVYSDGKLQDERSKPDGLLVALRNNATQAAAAPSITPPAATLPQKTIAPTTTTASPMAASSVQDTSLPYGKPVPGKPGFVQSPYDPKFLIDVRAFPPGTLVNDPNTNKPFRVP